MGRKNNIERNKIDYLLTDIMPVEISELFSYGKLKVIIFFILEDKTSKYFVFCISLSIFAFIGIK